MKGSLRYKKEKSLEERKKESQNIMCKYYDRVPVIVEKLSDNDLDIDKNKYLVPVEFTLGHFIYVLRKRMNVSPEQSMFVLIGGTYHTISIDILNLYEHYKDEDGFLYVTYSTNESVFG